MLESLFDPRDSSPLSVVVEMNDPDYCESKATELIREAKLTRKAPGQNSAAQADEKIAQAISLLALARVQRGGVHS